MRKEYQHTITICGEMPNEENVYKALKLKLDWSLKKSLKYVLEIVWWKIVKKSLSESYPDEDTSQMLHGNSQDRFFDYTVVVQYKQV